VTGRLWMPRSLVKSSLSFLKKQYTANQSLLITPLLLLTFARLFNDVNYCDLKITLTHANRTWSVHKAIVCPQSSFFAKAIETFTKILENSVVLESEEDPEILDTLLRYMYEQTYTVPTRAKNQSHLVGIRTPGVCVTSWNMSKLKRNVCAKFNAKFWSSSMRTQFPNSTYFAAYSMAKPQ
jgi:hypothetical protein